MEYAESLQSELCKIDSDDIDGKIAVIESLFRQTGLSFDSFSADEKFALNNHLTNLDNATSLLYGVWHPSNHSVTPVLFSSLFHCVDIHHSLYGTESERNGESQG